MTLYVVSVNFNLFSVSLYVVLITGFGLLSVWVRNDLITRQNALAERCYHYREKWNDKRCNNVKFPPKMTQGNRKPTRKQYFA